MTLHRARTPAGCPDPASELGHLMPSPCSDTPDGRPVPARSWGSRCPVPAATAPQVRRDAGASRALPTRRPSGPAVLGDELVAGHDVAHLVGAAQLDAAAVVQVEVQEVVRLQRGVQELGEAHTVGAAQPRLAALPAQQRAHAEPTAGAAEEDRKSVV